MNTHAVVRSFRQGATKGAFLAIHTALMEGIGNPPIVDRSVNSNKTRWVAYKAALWTLYEGLRWLLHLEDEGDPQYGALVSLHALVGQLFAHSLRVSVSTPGQKPCYHYYMQVANLTLPTGSTNDSRKARGHGPHPSLPDASAFWEWVFGGLITAIFADYEGRYANRFEERNAFLELELRINAFAADDAIQDLGWSLEQVDAHLSTAASLRQPVNAFRLTNLLSQYSPRWVQLFRPRTVAIIQPTALLGPASGPAIEMVLPDPVVQGSHQALLGPALPDPPAVQPLDHAAGVGDVADFDSFPFDGS